jgi:uncharacterized Zn finger protein
MDYFYYGWKPHVSAAARRAQAARELAKLQKKGRPLAPVRIDGRKIATTFWGKAWCENLERYSDFANRLPRGRTYVRNGSVLDLQIEGGRATALVSGSSVYTTVIDVTAVGRARWRDICRDCSGAIDSLIELLQGKLSTRVMTRLCEPKRGLFPEPKEVSFHCSCPDYAWMCKHVAAVLYGVGARLDERPELLFLLRGVDQQDLIAKAGTELRVTAGNGARGKVLESEDLSEMFGIELDSTPVPEPVPGADRRRRAREKPPATTARMARASSTTTKKEGAETTRAAHPSSTRPKWGSPAKRKAISERMKKLWAQRRAAASRQREELSSAARKKAAASAAQAKTSAAAARVAPPPRGAAKKKRAVGSEAWRREVSERMKKYWAERRRRFDR